MTREREHQVGLDLRHPPSITISIRCYLHPEPILMVQLIPRRTPCISIKHGLLAVSLVTARKAWAMPETREEREGLGSAAWQ